MMRKKDCDCISMSNPSDYTEVELQKLRDFISTIKNDTTRSELICWGDHSDYSRGY